MRSLSAYAQVGTALVLAGVIAAPVFFFVASSISLTALALSATLLGSISLLLARSLPTVPPQAAELILEAGHENLAELLEEIGINSKAIYLPSTLAGGKPRALIPLRADSARATITRPLLRRMIVDFGPAPEDVGILVTTPGTAVIQLLETPPGATSSELEVALARVLVGALDLATSVQVAEEPGGLSVTIAGARLDREALWIFRSLGTPIASITATLVAEGLGAPVMIRSEDRAANRLMIHLEVAR